MEADDKAEKPEAVKPRRRGAAAIASAEAAPEGQKPEVSKAHVDFYLLARNVPVWERGGRRAFAKQHNLEFATDSEFDALFKKY